MFRLAAVLTTLVTPAFAEVPRVATDILPVHSLVARIMDGVGTPDLILPPGASPHGYAMRPSEAAMLEKADVVFWVGPELTPWLKAPLDALADDARNVELLESEGLILLESTEVHMDEPADVGEKQHAEEDGEHGPVDPHVWLDPENVRVWLRVIAGVLSEHDPDNAPVYAANLAAAQAETMRLLGTMQTALAPLRETSFSVYHDAYGYLETRFGITPAFALLSSEAENPSPRRIAEMRARAQNEAIAVIVTEPQFDTRLADTVFEGLDVVRCPVDIIGADLPAGPSQYWGSMMAMVETLGDCATR